METVKTPTKLEMRPVDALIPFADNGRIHSEAQIAKIKWSIHEFGFVMPLLIDAAGNIIDGHARLRAAVAQGMREVPCVLVEHLSEIQRQAYFYANNRLAEDAEWTRKLVAIQLQKLRDAGFDITITGFSEDDMMLVEDSEPAEDDFECVLPAAPKAKRGQIWSLGQHRLMCGDASVPADLQQLMAGNKADLLLTDPPYNVDVTGATGEHLKIANDNMDEGAFAALLRASLTAAADILEPGASFYIWHPDGEQGRIFRDVCHEAGLRVRQCLIWVKNNATLSRQDYHWQHEPCLHGQMDAPFLECGTTWDDHESCLYGWTDGKSHLWCSDRKQTTVLEYDKPIRNADHPTMKPVRLFAYQIANSTLPDAKVLDCFAGSGTTAIACEQMGRRAYLMEIDPRCVDVIISRWETFTGQKAVLLNGE